MGDNKIFRRNHGMVVFDPKKEAVALLEHHWLYNYVGQDSFYEVEFFETPISLYRGEDVLLMTDGFIKYSMTPLKFGMKNRQLLNKKERMLNKYLMVR